MLTQDNLWKMEMRKLEAEIARYSPGSAAWINAWPIYEMRRHRIEVARTLIYFAISTAIALFALIRTFISK